MAGNAVLSYEFLNRKELLGEMAAQADERAFDLYLYLLKEYGGNKRARGVLNYEKAAKAIGLDGMTKESYRRAISRTLRKLKEKYKLLDLKMKHGKDAGVSLKDYADFTKPYAPPETRFAQIPSAFWDYGWARTLSFSAKVMTLLNLAYSAIGDVPPRWHSSGKTLSERHHISTWFISRGTTELRRLNLVEVEYDEFPETGHERRTPNVYLPNPLYDPKKRTKQFKRLENLYGKKAVERAKKIAAVVYKDNDVNGIERLIGLEKRYGRGVVDQAVRIVSLKNEDNPKRSLGYLIGTIEGIAGAGRQGA